jgi:hypothetical protein
MLQTEMFQTEIIMQTELIQPETNRIVCCQAEMFQIELLQTELFKLKSYKSDQTELLQTESNVVNRAVCKPYCPDLLYLSVKYLTGFANQIGSNMSRCPNGFNCASRCADFQRRSRPSNLSNLQASSRAHSVNRNVREFFKYFRNIS